MKFPSPLALAATVLFGGLIGCVTPYDVSGGAVVTSSYQPGYVVTSLPAGYRTVTYGGTRYYQHDNVYYRPRGSGYAVVDRPRAAGPVRRDWDRDGIRNRRDPNPTRYDRDITVIRNLPPGYRVVERGGNRYYRAGDTYYERRANGYVAVRQPY